VAPPGVTRYQKETKLATRTPEIYPMRGGLRASSTGGNRDRFSDRRRAEVCRNAVFSAAREPG
jgi:hypothetical protein